MLLTGADGNRLNVKSLQLADGKMINAKDYGATSEEQVELELTEEEQAIPGQIKEIWSGILNMDVDDSTDFFGAGAASMDVARLVEVVNIEGQLPWNLFTRSKNPVKTANKKLYVI